MEKWLCSCLSNLFLKFSWENEIYVGDHCIIFSELSLTLWHTYKHMSHLILLPFFNVRSCWASVKIITSFLLLILFPSYVIQLDRELRNRKVFRKRKSAAWKGSYMQTALTLMELINISCNVSYAQSLRYYVCNAKSFLKIIAQGSIIVGPNKFALHMAWLLDIHYWLKTTPW